MKIINTSEMNDIASFNAIVYGLGGVGKTTMASTFPKPLLLDFENGAKYFKQRGISLDTIQFTNWFTDKDKIELKGIIENYETVILDPIGTAMQMLIDDKEIIKGSKYRQVSGDLTMAGWGEAKKQMRSFVQFLLGTGKNIILNAHVVEDKDESTGQTIKRPLIPTGLKDELITMVDVVAYLINQEQKSEDGESKIIRALDLRTGMPYIAKDRTGALSGKAVTPDWSSIKKHLEKVVKKDEVAKDDKVEEVKEEKKTPKKSSEVKDEEIPVVTNKDKK